MLRPQFREDKAMARRLGRLGISVALGSFLALACGGEEKSETPGAAATTSEAPAPGAPVQPEKVEIIQDVWLTTLPENFPEDIPRYPGAEVVKARPASEDGISVGFSTSDDPAKVAAYFADQFAAQGWATNRVDAPEGIMVFADKGDRSATYGVASADGKTQIDLLVVKMR
jgi:hypothetical protein